MFKGYRRTVWILTALPLLLVALFLGSGLWNYLQKPDPLTADSYAYLEKIPEKLVLDCQSEGENIAETAWADLLAIKSTLPIPLQTPLITQLKSGKPFKKLSWQAEGVAIGKNQIKLVTQRREILLRTRYYAPGAFVFPISGENWYMDTFGSDREGGARKHEGTDVFAAEGTDLFSVGAGRVERLGWNRLGGERVGIRGEDGNYFYYAHLQTINPELKIGQWLPKGTKIGTVGHTGDALTTPDHLHFGIELPDGTWINPYPYLKVWQQQKKEAPKTVYVD